VIWSFCMLVSETTGDQMMLAYSIAGKIRDLYVASSVSFFPQCVAVRALRILVVRFAFVLDYFDVFTEIECRI